MNTKQDKLQKFIIAILPLVFAVLIMTPRLLSAQFGLLDDGAMLAEVRKILGGDLSMRHDLQAGRFRPLYWFYFTLIYSLAGPVPFWFFFGQMILLLILVIEIRVLMKKNHAETWQIWISSLIFILSMPIIENYYTLSKGEPIQLIFILAAVIFLDDLKNASCKRSQWLFAVLSFFSILAAMLVKETTVIIIPITTVWAGYSFINPKKSPPKERRALLYFLVAVIIAIAVFFILRTSWGAPSVSGGTYTELYTFSLMSILAKFARWMTLLAFYFHYLLPLGLIALLVFFTIGYHENALNQNLFIWSSWSLLWIVILIPWEYTEVYYLLPFSLGISILIGLFLPKVCRLIQQRQKETWWITKSLLILSVVFFLATLTNFRTHGRIQLTFDLVNQQMLADAQNNIPENGDAFTGMDAHNEYVRNIERFLIDQYARTDIYYDFVSLQTLEGLHHFSKGILMLPYIKNQPNLLLRAGVEEQFTMAWREIILFTMGDRLTELAKTRGDFQLFNINLPVIACPILGEIGFCENPDPFIDTRTISYGWEVYSIR